MTNFEMLRKKMLNEEKIILPSIDGKVSFAVTDTRGYTAQKMANDIAKAISRYYLEWANKEANR